MKPRLYLETTIPSYLTSRPSRDLIIARRQQMTKDWWEARWHAFEPYISQLVVDVAGAGDPAAARERVQFVFFRDAWFGRREHSVLPCGAGRACNFSQERY